VSDPPVLQQGVIWGLLAVALFLLLLGRWLVLRHGRRWGALARRTWRRLTSACVAMPLVGRLNQQYPALSAFLARRFRSNRFSGLPSLLLLLALLYVLALFAGTVEDVVTADTIVVIDKQVAHWVAQYRDPLLVYLAYVVSQLGAWQVVTGFLLAGVVGLALIRRAWMALPMLMSFGGGMGFALLGKLAFQRPRPVDAVVVEPSYAFPSAHATLALSFYGYLGYLLVRHASCYRHAVNRLFATLTLVFLLGASRVALGVHYLSDVWSGYLVGALWLIIGVSLNEWMTASGRFVACRQRPIAGRGTLAALVIAALLWYFLFVALHPPGFA